VTIAIGSASDLFAAVVRPRHVLIDDVPAGLPVEIHDSVLLLPHVGLVGLMGEPKLPLARPQPY
jgi:hypothetical protein